jgi:hypothetical protein
MFAADDTASPTRPFIGLRPFEYRDRAFFFGRSESIDVVEQLVARSGLVAVIGSSGTGKSSLIRAGLLPRLEGRSGERWRWGTMEPGGAPIHRLARAISSLRGPRDELTDAWTERIEFFLRGSKFGVAEALSLFPDSAKGAHYAIIVDQFEEVFRFAELRTSQASASVSASLNRDEATAFVQLLLAAENIETIHVHIVLTMRSDFIGDCARFHDLPEAVTRHQFLVPGLTRDQRASAILSPVEAAGADIDLELVQRILNDTNEDPDQLPIIQHAMMRCWQSAASRVGPGQRIRVEIEDYNEIGGVVNALSIHANQIFEQFSHEGAGGSSISPKLAAKRVFQALTEVDQEGRVVRRPMRFGDLVLYVASTDWDEAEARRAVLSVVRRLAAPDCSFLRLTSAGELDDNSIVDIGHEALIRRWDQLKGGGETDWIREEQEDGEKYRDLVRIARAHSSIPGAELTAFEDWWARRKPSATWARRFSKSGADYFAEVNEALARSRAEFDESERRRQLAEKAERDAQQAQLKLAAATAQAEAEGARASAAEEKAKAAAAEVAIHVQRDRMMRWAAVATGVFIAAAVLAGVRFLKYQEALQRQRQEIVTTQRTIEQQRDQQQKALAALAARILSTPRLVGAADALSLLIALPDKNWNEGYFDAVDKSLSLLREVRRIVKYSAPVISVSANPKKPLLVAVTPGSPPMMNFVEFGDGGGKVSPISPMSFPVAVSGWGSARWSPDGERIFVGGAGAKGMIVTPCAAEKLRPFFERCAGKAANEYLEVGDEDHQAGFGVWSGDGALILTNTFLGQPNVWNSSTGKLDPALTSIIDALQGTEDALSVTSIAVSPTGALVAAGQSNGDIAIVRVDSKETLTLLKSGQTGFSPTQMYFDPVDETLLLAIYQNPRAALWNLTTGVKQDLDHNEATVMQAAFDPKGKFIVTSAQDGTVRLWTLGEGAKVNTLARASWTGVYRRRQLGRRDRVGVGR